jgi:hypothetical protein
MGSPWMLVWEAALRLMGLKASDRSTEVAVLLLRWRVDLNAIPA